MILFPKKIHRLAYIRMLSLLKESRQRANVMKKGFLQGISEE